MKTNPNKESLLFVGTYAQKESEGIYVCTLDGDSGEIRTKGSISGIENPSFLTVDSEKAVLYAVSEASFFGEIPGGSVSSYSISPDDGSLIGLQSVPAHGEATCYVSLDPHRRWLLVSNYSGGASPFTRWMRTGRQARARISSGMRVLP
ncbi:lactonase family protein [Paenibacillus sp. CC-CFT747]|nr:lactonase family protein [Paenibacillus sp. CC-CFT747]